MHSHPGALSLSALLLNLCALCAAQVGLGETARLREGTHARGAAHMLRMRREQAWLDQANDRLAQQRASQARLYVDATADEAAQRASAAEASSAAAECIEARCDLVPLCDALGKEVAQRARP